MKARLIIILFAVLSFLFPEKLISQKVYLSPNGSDNNEGSVGKPLATLNAAREKARMLHSSAPDNQSVEIIALGGEYFMIQPLILSPEDGGTKASPLIIRSETGQKVLFRGGVPVTGFAKINEKLWKAFVPQVAFYNSYFEQLYVNGKRATRARTPDSGFFNSGKVEETTVEKGTGSFPLLAVQKINIDSSDLSCFNSFTPQDYQDALIVFYHNWDNTRKRITGFSRENSSVYTVGEGMKPWNPINEKSRYIVENYRAALNSPGEWFLDRTGYLYYVPREGETIENTTFIAPVLKEFIVIRGDQATGKKVENISFENVSFGYAGYQTPPSGNEPAQAAFNADAVVTLDFANIISFTNCEFAHTGTYGIWFRKACSNCTVSQCYLHDLGGGGVKIGEPVISRVKEEITGTITVDNNIIYFDRGTLLSSNWHEFNLASDYNCFWDSRTKDVRFAGKSFAEWQRSGKDVHSVIADPLFVNPEAFDFHFKKLTVARKIKFVPFDYSKAGVYGSSEWKKLAEFDPGLAIKFDEIVDERETSAGVRNNK